MRGKITLMLFIFLPFSLPIPTRLEVSFFLCKSRFYALCLHLDFQSVIFDIIAVKKQNISHTFCLEYGSADSRLPRFAERSRNRHLFFFFPRSFSETPSESLIAERISLLLGSRRGGSSFTDFAPQGSLVILE